ncbi:KpsF/GutQ family sugar-phosphate isomerase [Porticoccus litoralis]|jgi:arabinose-5-phosphate isomerase|uniref:Arabinose 5-phosphate isomerase n=1 Tax=Porticoccus litoralis TaxID=434086 RepID=A0AAW8B0L0_9GAMM|nr:KpsF/GutQ family sugar-phosphate isomerase [Porticoccus litoralis]MDP1520067.1 KpsF/GutQ family sugar-phosphate isomerase [Porticoccus litoralis]TNE89759.1 MAG: KpsF/GutQ family sugar-phosphate isomerase [Gammaproteobacteria bacterium]
MSTVNLTEAARRTIRLEAEAVSLLEARIGETFEHACSLILQCTGRVIVTGMGKSGHIGRKIAASLASTGTPSFFVHPGEASHGDLGMITDKDVVLALSNSGSTAEVITLLPLIKRMGIPLISMTGNPDSVLGTASDAHLDVSVPSEACPLGLAPTTSTTATLAMGDALAIALLEARGFTAEDFAFSHPGGALGRKLLLKVKDIMHSGSELPRVEETAQLKHALLEMTTKGFGMTTVVNSSGEILGVFTDGDLRRAVDQDVDINHSQVGQLIRHGCKAVQPELLAAEALKVMEDFKITALVVEDSSHHPIGVLHMHDILRAGVM